VNHTNSFLITEEDKFVLW